MNSLDNSRRRRFAAMPAAAILAGCGLLAATIGAPGADAVNNPPGSLLCNATGGNNISGTTTFVHKFTSSGTFTPRQTMTVTYLVVGGGGGGGGGRGGNTNGNAAGGAGGGGGAGEYLTSSVQMNANVPYAIVVGAGGGGSTGSVRGLVGGDSSITGVGLTTITANGGAGGAAGQTLSDAPAITTGASNGGGGGALSPTAVTAGSASSPGFAGSAGRQSNTPGNRNGGGGGGSSNTGIASAGNGRGGGGGPATSNSISGTATGYAAGGGGGGRTSAGPGGLDGVVRIGGVGGTTGNAGTAPVANTGSGGGGAGSSTTAATNTSGGNGSDGIVFLTYPANGGCPGAPAVSFSTPTLTIGAVTPPTGQTITTWTVLVKPQGTPDNDYSIYARRLSATPATIDIKRQTKLGCDGANTANGWICATGLNLANGTYDFAVIVRTSSTGYDVALGTLTATAISIGKISAATTVALP